MYEVTLEALGLTKSEISTYLALLDLGPSTTGPLIKKAQIASGKAYIILDKLIEKGLVTYTIISGTKTYQAKDPNRLLDYLNEKMTLLLEKMLFKYKTIINNLKIFKRYFFSKKNKLIKIPKTKKIFEDFRYNKSIMIKFIR